MAKTKKSASRIIAEPIEESTRLCTECGKEVNASAKFCPKCGAELPVIPKPEKTPAPDAEQHAAPEVVAPTLTLNIKKEAKGKFCLDEMSEKTLAKFFAENGLTKQSDGFCFYMEWLFMTDSERRNAEYRYRQSGGLFSALSLNYKSPEQIIYEKRNEFMKSLKENGTSAKSGKKKKTNS